MADQEQIVPQSLTFSQRIKQDLKDLWNKDRLFLIGFISLILLIKFRDIMIDILVASSKKLLKDTQKQDDTLKKEETDANNKANQLIEQAKNESTKEDKVDADWYKKDQ